MYRIYRSIANDGRTWIQSDSYPNTYTRGESDAICGSAHPCGLKYRMVAVFEPVASVPRKAYRRHAQITPLELRGAYRMLQSACKYIVSEGDNPIIGLGAFGAYQILWDARLNVTRALEAL